MKRSIFGLALAGLLVASPARASILPTNYVFDEDGNWSINGVKQTKASVVGGVLTFDLGVGSVIEGDVKVTEPPSTTALSDVLRFTNSEAGHVILRVYSDKGDKQPGDTGFPATFNDNTVKRTEVGPDKGPNGLIYEPSSSTAKPEPGYISGKDAIYTFISDTPEPSTIVLAGLGGLALAGYSLRRRKLALA